jgi:hypothetical protein
VFFFVCKDSALKAHAVSVSDRRRTLEEGEGTNLVWRVYKLSTLQFVEVFATLRRLYPS